MVAGLSICAPDTVRGLLLLDNSAFEIHPLSDRLKNIIANSHRNYKRLNSTGRNTHIIKRAKIPPGYQNSFSTAGNIWDENEPKYVQNFPVMYRDRFNVAVNEIDTHRNHYPMKNSHLTLELALFFDEAAYRIFAPHMNYDERKIQDMLLAYVNGVQALYHHPSLGTRLDLVLVRLDIMKSQPPDMPHYNGERGLLLDSFCAYQKKVNPPEDADPEHWDMALYISGLDFFAYENGRKSSVTMGLATVGGVCHDQYACVIAEFGTTNVFGKPYPSAGFTSVYILAHEIGHNLGMHHDNTGNSCPKEGYIMSPSRGTNGETQWSPCSAEVMSRLGWAKCLQDSSRPPKSMDHSQFLNSPGQVFTAKRQCEILLRDRDAVVAPGQQQSSICYNLQCKTPHRTGYYFAGPALEGTQCGNNLYCFGGECINKLPPRPPKVVPGGWGPWKEERCTSSCIDKSKGFFTKRRYCNNPAPVNTDQGCEGPSMDISICDDDYICRTNRLTAVEYASMKCQEYSKLLPELDSTGAGLQSPHANDRIWMGCAIFCKRADSDGYYTPRIELNDLGVSSYFPDGTWCHRDNANINYYCVQHHCLPETFKFSKVDPTSDFEDIPISQNAIPLQVIPQHIKDYFSLGPDGKPIKTSLKPMDAMPPEDTLFETDDYVVIPELENNVEHMIDNMDDFEYNYFMV